MREYKFRAYDLQGEQMRYDITGFEFFNDGEMSGIFIDGDFYDKKEIALMQYTGIKDENGKEIYEGDILQIDVDKAWVMWNDKYGYFQLVPIGDYYFDSDVIGQALEYTKPEVIGNIYENKELLNETNR